MKNLFKKIVQHRWQGNAIAEYMPTLTLIGAFMIAIVMVGGREVAGIFGHVNNCLQQAQAGQADADCGCPLDIDFDGLAAGTILSDPNNQIFPGMTISTNNHGEYPVRIFDSGNPTGGDWDLGTPNWQFGGPGGSNNKKGYGGWAGMPGENSEALGNVIIIDEGWKDGKAPDDYGGGGWVRFDFDSPAIVSYMHFLDVDEPNALTVSIMGPNDEVKLTRDFSDKSFPTHTPDGTKITGHKGDNSVMLLDVNMRDVYAIRVDYPGSGAIAGVFFCE